MNDQIGANFFFSSKGHSHVFSFEDFVSYDDYDSHFNTPELHYFTRTDIKKLYKTNLMPNKTSSNGFFMCDVKKSREGQYFNMNRIMDLGSP